ncbi:hypothetical protein [Rubrivivax gelatinosus]|uniref:Uncharacterized protein n=1 Tax=Rubrivivax gelatinosus TaxID=28068 RepID=A0A4V2SGJ9_RUBGE|nr:hypothetical protein [Rubrivivax gelatinosus]MBK1689643.1 hypothetical protein [Rubrivivax gelatinosus]TCP01218.1 hypothetical protein EV684_110149 [Rubrivivax gelatinosus]
MARDPEIPQDEGSRAADDDGCTAEGGAPAQPPGETRGAAPCAPTLRDGEAAAASPSAAAAEPGFVRRFRRGRWTVTEAPR